MIKRVLTVPILLAGFSLWAQDSTKVKQLDQVVVTATKFPIKQSLTGKVVTIITREQLAKNSGKSLGELLTTQAGIYINGASNTPGTNPDVYMRGAGTGKTLILVNGIPAYDPSGTSGAFDLNLFSIDQIERIEILKGSQSTLYGSDAMAGVINIITKKGSGRPVNFSASLSAGSYGSLKTSAGLDGEKGGLTYSFQYTKYRTDGISSAYDENHTGGFDRDGFNKDVWMANAQQKIRGGLTLKIFGQYVRDKSDLDAGAFADDKDFTAANKNKQVGAGIDYAIGQSVLHFNYNYNTVTRSFVDDSTDGSGMYSRGSYTGNAHFAELYSNIPLQKHLELLAGLDYRHQSTDQDYLSVSAYGPYHTGLGKDSAAVNQLGTYASLVLKDLHGFNFEAGGRYNSFNQYGNVFTWSFNPSFTIHDEVKIFANASSGFKAPSLYELYSEYRNPFTELKPEKSVSLEGGIQYDHHGLNARIVYFNRRITDNIIFYSGGAPDYLSYYMNSDRQNDHGLEAEAGMHMGKWRLAANYAFTDGKVTTQVDGKDTTYFNLFRRPKNAFHAEAGMDITKRFYADLALRTVGKRSEFIYGGMPVALSAYYTIDAYLEYRIVKAVKAFADLKNITNQEYFDVYGYTSKRFNFMAGVNINL